MATPNRAAIISKAHKVLKKHFKAVAHVPERTLLENLLYACCLEDARYDEANESLARLQESYFDWNEVRVTTVRELAEVLRSLPDASLAASRVKETLQSVFECFYSFDLEHLKKQNIGKTIATVEKLRGTSPFSVAYVTQTSLGGHAIPLGKGEIEVMYTIGVINDKERHAGSVPGLERAISKSKGAEFASLLHQLAAELIAAPQAPSVRSVLLEIDPECRSRLPKRGGAKKSEPTTDATDQKSRQAATTKRKKPAPQTRHAAAKSKKKSPKSLVKKSRPKINKKSTSKQLARRKPR